MPVFIKMCPLKSVCKRITVASHCTKTIEKVPFRQPFFLTAWCSCSAVVFVVVVKTVKTDKEKTILPNKTLLFGNSKSEVVFYLSTYFLLSARNLDFLLR